MTISDKVMSLAPVSTESVVNHLEQLFGTKSGVTATIEDCDEPLILFDYVEKLYTGSSVICPGPDNNDTDVVFLINRSMSELFRELVAWDTYLGEACQNRLDISGAEQYVPGKMLCVRHGKYNYIITNDSTFFNRWKVATQTALTLGADAMRHKDDRVALFKAILYAGDRNETIQIQEGV